MPSRPRSRETAGQRFRRVCRRRRGSPRRPPRKLRGRNRPGGNAPRAVRSRPKTLSAPKPSPPRATARTARRGGTAPARGPPSGGNGGNIGQDGDAVGVELRMRADPGQRRFARAMSRLSVAAAPATACCTSPCSERLFQAARRFECLEQRPSLFAKPLGQRLEAAGARRRDRRRSRAWPRSAPRVACCAPAVARRRRAARALGVNGSSVTLSAPPRPAAKAASAARMTFT